MRKAILLLLAASLLSWACEDPRKKQIQTINTDAEVMAKASAAVSEVVRNETDCEVAKPLLTEAYQRIGEAQGKVQLAASQQTLAMMRTQVDHVARMCP
jgi:CHASE3 domain sensor protein